MSDYLLNLPTVFIIGLVFGIGPCTITCLPYLGPVFLSKQGGIRDSWKIILPFSMGRMSSYSALGALSGYAGASVDEMIHTPLIAWLLGGATVSVGLLIFWRSYRNKLACGSHGNRPKLQDNPFLPGGLFFMGVGMAATPCAPLATIMLTAAATASTYSGFLLGFCFGIGAVLVPALVFGIGMAYFGQRIREIMQVWRSTLERASACLLIVLGIGTITG
jgi:sulfite exporter TauE/SafE